MVAEFLGGDGDLGVACVPGEEGGTLARERHQRRRLAVRLGQVVLEGQPLLRRRLQLHDFPLHEGLQRLGHLLSHRRHPEARQRHRGAREQEIAGKHRRLGRVQLVHRLAASARVGTIEDVVVHQRRRVDHLGDRRQPLVLRSDLGLLLLLLLLRVVVCPRGRRRHRRLRA